MSLLVSNQMVGKSLFANNQAATYVASNYETAGQIAFGGYETAGQVATNTSSSSCGVNTYA